MIIILSMKSYNIELIVTLCASIWRFLILGKIFFFTSFSYIFLAIMFSNLPTTYLYFRASPLIPSKVI